MKIHATIKDLRQEYNFDAPGLLAKIFEECPIVEELFPKRFCLGNPIKYKIKYSDERLRELMSQIDKYRNRLNGYDSSISPPTWSFRRLALVSMSKKKDIDVVWFE